MPSVDTPEDVRRVLTERISAGHLRPGQRLGAERALASDLGGTLAGPAAGHRHAAALGLALAPAGPAS